MTAWETASMFTRLGLARGCMRLAVTTLLLLVPLSAAQHSHAEVGASVYLEGAEHLETFFRALTRRERGVGLTRITHIGDSHIIADFWTGRMRRLLQSRFGDGGRGFVLGGRMWKSYGQHHIKHRSMGDWEVTTLKRGRDLGVFGPGGAALFCPHNCKRCTERERKRREPCMTSVETAPEAIASEFDLLDVYTLGHGQGGRFRVSIDQRPLAEQSTFSPWLMTQRHRFHVTQGAHRVSFEPIGAQGETWLFGFSLTKSQGGLVYDSIGLNGAQAKHLLRNESKSLAHGIELLDPTLIVLSFGINEVFDHHYNRDAYHTALSYVLSALRVSRPHSTPHQPSCLLTGPFAALKGGRPPPELDEVYEIQRELASAYRCAFWDARRAMGGKMRAWQHVGLGRKDGVHLSRGGYQRIAQLFEESLLMTWERWKLGGDL